MNGGLPIGADEFAHWVAALGPFENCPRLAVAVSGGGDSMALCLLADEWVRRRQGEVTALIVDHGLRAASAAEAEQVRGWLSAREIRSCVLPWRGVKPCTGVQAAARRARYRLMLDWCRDNDVLHLLLGHHAHDQAETVLMRLIRGSGLRGLRGMQPVTETTGARLLRPLLAMAPCRLRATLAARRQAWLEDPGNADPAYARTLVRQALALPGTTGIDSDRLTALAGLAGAATAAIDSGVAALVAAAAALHPSGYVRLDRELLRRSSGELARRVLGQVLTCVGGRQWQPGEDALDHLLPAVVDGGDGHPGSLGRCRLIAVRQGRELLVCREARGLPPPIAVRQRQEVLSWDGRFRIRIVARKPVPPGLVLAPLTAAGCRFLLRAQQALRAHPLPFAARLALPALFDRDGVVAVPHLGYRRTGSDVCNRLQMQADFSPMQALAGTGYFLA